MNKNLLLFAAGVGLLLLLNKGNSNPAANPVGTSAEHEDLIAAWISKMKATPEWVDNIAQKAAANGLSMDEQYRIDAIWVINQGWSLT